MNVSMKRIFGYGLTILVVAVLGVVISGQMYVLANFSYILIWAIAGMGMVLLIGFGGQLSLGHAAFVAIGGYATAMITTNLGGSPGMLVLGVLVGMLISVFFALLIGLPALRLKGYYLAIATIAFGVGVEQAIRATEWLGSARGIYNIPQLFGMSRLADIWVFLTVLAVFLVLYTVGLIIIKSPYGIKFRMIRDSEVAARSYGTDLTKNKLLVFILSAIFCSVAGSMYAMTQGLVFPETFGLMAAINLLLIIIIGGATMLEGALIGSLIIMGLPLLLSDAPGGSLSLINGILLILFVLLLPKGIAFELFILWVTRLQKPYIKVLRFFYRLKPTFGKYVEVAPDTCIHYVEKGEGKTLLYLHGNFASHIWYREVMDVPGYRTVAPDLVNFGRSDRVSGSDIDTYADSVAAFIDKLGLESVYVVGHSLGGAVAISLALRYPQKVNRMLLLDSSPVDGVKVSEEFYPIIEATKNNYSLLKQAVAKIMGTRSADLKLAACFTKEGLLMNTESFVGNAKALARFDYTDKARTNRVPTLAVVGAFDPVVSIDDCERTAKALNGESRVIEHVGHALNIEDPQLFIKTVTEFDTE